MVLGPDAGLPNPVLSAHNAHGDWGPPPGTPTTALCVGEFGADDLRASWSEVTELAPITMPVDDQEVQGHAAIYLCRRPHGTWAQLWPALRHYD